MDRTNWKFVKSNINILMPGKIYKPEFFIRKFNARSQTPYGNALVSKTLFCKTLLL